MEMKSAKVDKEIINSVYDFLTSCDLVKFAKYIPLKEEIEKDWNQAYTIVSITKAEEVKAEVLTP
jgi:hypothetical protein